MFSVLQNSILPYLTKYLVPVLGTGCLLLIVYCVYCNGKYDDMYDMYCREKLAKELLQSQYDLEQLKFKHTLSQQNSTIEQYQINFKQFESTVSSKEKELAETRFKLQEQIKNELKIDSSNSNQLAIMSKVLNEFSKGN